MADEKKKKDYFPDLEYRFFDIEFNEKEIEGIQGPVYRPSGQVMDLGDADTIGLEEPGEVFHDGEAKVYELSGQEFALDTGGGKEPEVLGYVECPKCGAPIPITSDERPLKIKCPSCGKTGRLE